MVQGKPQIKDSEVVDAYDQVCAPDSTQNWFAFTCTETDDVVLCGTGAGGIDELRRVMKDKEISIGFLKLAQDSYGLVSYISLEAAAGRVSSALLMLQEAKLLFIHEYFLDFTRPEDLSLEALKANGRESTTGLPPKQPSLKKRNTLKKKKESAEGEEKPKKKKKDTTEKEADDATEEAAKRAKKKKADVNEVTTELKKTDLGEKTLSSGGIKRSKSLRKKTDGAEDAGEKKSKKKDEEVPSAPVISIEEAPLVRKKSLKASKKKSTDDLLQIASHTKEASTTSTASYHHSRDASASSDVSDEARQYCKAINHNIAKSEEDLMFIKGDIIQVVEKTSDYSWVGICCGVEGTFDPSLVMLLPLGFKPKLEASGSEVSADSFSDALSDTDDEDDAQGASNKNRNREFSEAGVVEWLYSAGFPQYVDMFQKRQVIHEGEVVHDHSFLSPLQIQSLLKRIRFLNEQTHKSIGSSSEAQQFQPSDATPISPHWNDSNPTTAGLAGYDSLPSANQPAGWGENLTRSKSKKKKKAKGISELTDRELDIARKLAILSITAMQEKSNKAKVTDFAVKTFNLMVGKKEDKEAKIFGAELPDLVERTGVPSKWTTGVIPKCLFKMLEAFEREEILKTVGLFRVPGKQNRINQLRDQCDASDGDVDFSELSGADLSGIIKMFFSRLPDSLFTSELYRSYIMVASMTNKRVQIETLQLLSILLPKENREIAACLLKFLSLVSQHKDVNKMDTKNIALVFAPTLFGDKRRKALKPSQADIDKDLQRQNKIAEVLQVMIDCQSVLWILPIDLQEQLEYTLQGSKTEKKKKWFFSSGRYPTL